MSDLEISRRRERFAVLRDRFLDPKTRLIGIDGNALKAQIDEKKAKEKAEKDAEKTWIQQQNEVEIVRKELQRKHMEMQKEEQKKMLNSIQKQADERKKQNELEQQRRQQQTGRIEFVGEDQQQKVRVQKQKEQQAAWIKAQLKQKQEQEQKLQTEENNFVQYQTQFSNERAQTEEERKRIKAEERRAYQEVNMKLANEKIHHENTQRSREAVENERELNAMAHSQLLREQVQVDANGKPAVDSFKGFTHEQRQAILNTQKTQIEDARHRQMLERQKEKEDAARQEQYRRQLVILERERQRAAAEKNRTLRAEHLRQRDEFARRTAHLDREVYINPVQDSYFDQFGTSCR